MLRLPRGSSSALTGVARIILALERLKEELPKDETFGQALVSLNKLFVSPNVANVIPDRCDAVVDARHPVSLPREKIVSTIQSSIAKAVTSQEGLKHTAEIKKARVVSYTGWKNGPTAACFPFTLPVITLLRFPFSIPSEPSSAINHGQVSGLFRVKQDIFRRFVGFRSLPLVLEKIVLHTTGMNM